MLTFGVSRRPFDRRFGDGPSLCAHHLEPPESRRRARSARWPPPPIPTGRRVLLDGAHLVREALDAGLGFEVILVAASRLGGATEAGRLARELQQRGLPMAEVDDRAFDAVSPVRTPSGIAAIARRKVQAPVDLCARPDALVLAAADVQDPGNVGALLRIGRSRRRHRRVRHRRVGQSVLVEGAARQHGQRAAPAHRRPGLTPTRSWRACARPACARSRRWPRGGADPDAIDWRGAVGLWIGGEGPGLPDELVARCDARVTIPMAPQVESLNVAVAGALLIYAARRQRSEAEPRS